MTHNLPSADADEANATDARVIFSLSVHSAIPIAAFEDVPGRLNTAPAGDKVFYDFGTASFVDANWDSRAEKLDAIVTASLDRIDATGVRPDELAGDGVFVKAFFTFDPGAETIGADLIQRLARIHATIWIDANETDSATVEGGPTGVPEETLARIESMLSKCDPPPWQSVVEGRDQLAGSSFIQTGGRGEDIYLTRDGGPVDDYLDLIALSVSSLPALIDEVRKSRANQDA